MHAVTIWSVLTTAIVAGVLLGSRAEASQASAPTLPARTAAPAQVPFSLPPAPPKAFDADLADWLQRVDRTQIEASEVQRRVPTEALITWLRSAWQQGVKPERVRASLQAAGWQSSNQDLQVLDVTGDGRPEWLLTVPLEPTDTPWGRPGDFWVIGEDLLYRFFQPGDYFRDRTEADAVPLDQDFLLSAPQVVATRDFTGDGVTDVLLRRQLCGAHTCTQAYFILSNQSGKLQQTIAAQKEEMQNSGQAIILYYSDLKGLQDETGDGVTDLTLHAGAIASAGAGYQRTRTEVWAWDGKAISLAQTWLDPTNYRHLILYEANDNFTKGNLARARTLYQQVVEDNSLEDVQWSQEMPSSHDSTVQFAAFRLVLLGLIENDDAAAQKWQDWLSSQYPGQPITEAARQLLASVEQTSLETACSIVRNYLVSLEKPESEDTFPGSGPTGQLRYMGYGNPSLSAVDVCPLGL